MSKKLFLLLLSLSVSIFVMSCGDDDEGTTGPGLSEFEVVQASLDAYVGGTKAPTISAQDLFDNLNDGDAGNDPVVLSVRSAAHYAIGHIPGAINIPWKEIGVSANLSGLPRDRQIAVYCYTGHTGMVAATVLGMMGYDTHNIKFGMMGWTKDDNVLATARFNPDTQPDYRLETTPIMPTSGGVPLDIPVAYGLLALGALSTGAGIFVKRRKAA